MSTELTHIERFNSNLKQFVLNICETFNEFDEILRSYYGPLLLSENCEDTKYVKRYMLKMRPYKELLSKKDESMFNNSVFVLKNVDFKIIWDSEELSSSNKDKIWKYIQTLYVLGDIIISTDTSVEEMLESLNKEEVIGSIDESMRNMMENLSKNSESAKNLFDDDELKNSSLGKFANELAEEFNPQEMFGNLNINESSDPADLLKTLMNKDNMSNLMNVFTKVGEKIKTKMDSNELDQESLFSDAQSMMGKLNNFMPGFNERVENSTHDRLRSKLEERKGNKN